MMVTVLNGETLYLSRPQNFMKIFESDLVFQKLVQANAKKKRLMHLKPLTKAH